MQGLVETIRFLGEKSKDKWKGAASGPSVPLVNQGMGCESRKAMTVEFWGKSELDGQGIPTR
jgi:hypothetical protein